MLKNNVCVIGTGGCGNKLLSVLMGIDRRYVPVFCNTNLTEMENLEHYNHETNSLYIASASGTGRNREKAVELIKQDQARILDFFASKYSPSSGINTFQLILSGDGGTGNGSMVMLVKVIKKINPNASVNLLIVAPALTEKELSFRNFKALWNDIIGLKSTGKINAIQFIDNNKMGKNEEEFNQRVMEEFDDAMSINNTEIDNSDSEKVNCAVGYKVSLRLEKNRSMQQAIDLAVENSNFIMPSSFDCEYLMASFMEDDFYKNDARDIFEVYELDKYDYNDDKNMIVLGACEMPKEYIQLVDIALSDLLEKKRNRNISDDLLVDIETTVQTKVETTKTTKKVSKKDLKKMMEDDSFWD